ncbi:alpha/beta fold hydrolase [Plantactinospora siamensis]|uniref:Alpha/beta fold hydrolase n=1 Tax=Plantactinospora siamensis TaxID=555372 RepID=A0ABV6NTJ5_9ACTN
MSGTDPTTVRAEDGRELEVLVTGPADGPVLVVHSGTPSAAADVPELSRPAAERGLRTVFYSRPGYAGSAPRPGRTVADAAADTRAVLDHLGCDRFVTVGTSGGGPHALACAAGLPDRCVAAATVAGVAPFEADGLDWYAGMGPENLEEFTAARDGAEALTAFLTAGQPGLAGITGADVAAALGGLASEVDRAALTGDFADALAESFRRSVSTGVAGWRDDDLAFVRPWGFDLSAIAVPVAVWQGAQDRTVPPQHGRWLAEHIRTARAHLYDDEGHLSLLLQGGRILDDLLGLAAGRL